MRAVIFGREERGEAVVPWLIDLFKADTPAHVLLVLGMVITVGLVLGRIRIFGIQPGVAGVLFSGLAAAHFGLGIGGTQLDFIRDFGLILFVFMVGLQVGPGFFASFRRQGLAINLAATVIVLSGSAIAVFYHLVLRFPLPAAVGILCGAVTNTPSLGAAQQAFREVSRPLAGGGDMAGLAYAVAYPFGVIGIIVTMILLRHLFRVRMEVEQDRFRAAQEVLFPAPCNVNLELRNPQLIGKPLRVIGEVIGAEVVVSRILRRGELFSPRFETLLEAGDVMLAIGSRENLEKLRLLIGDESRIDLKSHAGPLAVRRILVTREQVIGRSLSSLNLRERYGINITRIFRAGMEFVPGGSVRLQFGDKLTVVGEEEMLKQLAGELGNSLKHLDFPNILPVFLGIAAGVLLGSVPFRIPGIPAQIKLGLAGGPLLVAILLSRFGHIGRFTPYLSGSANLALRETGIVLFLATVGLRSGAGFLHTVIHAGGLNWMLLGAVVTVLPLLLAGIAVRFLLKADFLAVCGLLAGSMTDPPALAFANSYTGSDAPAVTYAAVYPLTTFLRIMVAQLIVLIFASG